VQGLNLDHHSEQHSRSDSLLILLWHYVDPRSSFCHRLDLLNAMLMLRLPSDIVLPRSKDSTSIVSAFLDCSNNLKEFEMGF